MSDVRFPLCDSRLASIFSLGVEIVHVLSVESSVAVETIAIASTVKSSELRLEYGMTREVKRPTLDATETGDC